MPFPQSDRVIYENNPLQEVICQLRFPTILQIVGEEPAAFQNRVRAYYPFYRREEGPTLPREVANILSQLQMRLAEETTAHWFMKDDGETATRISLAPGFLAVSVGKGKYRRWEEFETEIVLGQKALEEVYTPTFYTRVGLRYRDVIDRSALNLSDVPWRELLNPGLTGLLASDELQDSVQGVKTEAVLAVKEVQDGFAKLQHGLINRQEAAGGEVAYLLDIDFYVEGRKEPDDVARILDRFNKLAGYFFRWAITDRLRDALKPRKLDD